jgi:hypothetical protein
VLALAAAGCGSSEDQVPEVPGPPAELSVPHVKNAPNISASATPTPSATPTATPGAATGTSGTTGTTGTTGSTGTTGGTTAGTGTTGGTGTGTTAPATQQDSAANDTAPAAGSAPQKFEQFCQENAGAC